MSVFNLDDDNNFVVTNGHFTFKTGADEVRQLIMHKLKLWYGEWFLARSKGIDFKGKILIKGPVANVVKAEIRKAIIDTKEVVSLDSFDLLQDNETRQLLINGTILTTYGVITLNQEVV